MRVKFYQSTDTDNRNLDEVNLYLEARIEALRRRIAELEQENRLLLDLLTEWNGGTTNETNC